MWSFLYAFKRNSADHLAKSSIEFFENVKSALRPDPSKVKSCVIQRSRFVLGNEGVACATRIDVRRLHISEGILSMSVEDRSTGDYVTLAVDIVSAYVGNNSLAVGEVPGLITAVHAALAQLSDKPAEPEEPALTPAVPIRRSIQQDFLVCLEDGKKFKSLKRHLRTRYNLSPDEYRARWNLPDDYPMVAPSYAATRSQLARTMGLGQQRRKWPAKTPPEAASELVQDGNAAPQRRRGRAHSGDAA
jgi:predicted transcriptional regulator